MQGQRAEWLYSSGSDLQGEAHSPALTSSDPLVGVGALLFGAIVVRVSGATSASGQEGDSPPHISAHSYILVPQKTCPIHALILLVEDSC